jgi:hypothetical protein
MAKVIKNKTTSITLTIPDYIYIEFKSRAYSEGYSVREALRYLVKNYAEDPKVSSSLLGNNHG